MELGKSLGKRDMPATENITEPSPSKNRSVRQVRIMPHFSGIIVTNLK